MIRLSIGILVGLGIALQYKQYAVVAFAIVAFVLVALLIERYAVVWQSPQQEQSIKKPLSRTKKGGEKSAI